MTDPLVLPLQHIHRRSWFAVAKDSDDIVTQSRIGEAPIPVIRDHGDHCWTWTDDGLARFVKEGDSEKKGDPENDKVVEWFCGKQRAEWLAAFEDDAIIWVRPGKGSGTPSSGSKGIWRIGSVEKGKHRLSFELVELIAHVR